jgi:hypothetical protein
MKDSNISFWVVPHEIATLDLGLTEKSILAVVFSFTRNGGECWATDKQFAVAFGMGERTIERAISRLYLLGYLERHVERKAGGVTPRRLSMTLPYRQIDATPHGELTPYRQIDATLAPNCPPPTVKMTLGYRQNDAQIVNNKNKEKEYIISTPLSQDDTPTPPEKNEVLKLDSVVKDSLTTEDPSFEKLESQVGEAPPIPGPPPEARRFIAAELPQEHRAKLLAQLTGPATRAGRDPEQVLVDILNRAEAWSNKGTDKKKFRVSWYETLKRQWVAREIKNLSEQAQRHPVSQTGLSRDQIDTLWDLGWKSYHKEDWPEPIPDPDWVTDWHRDLFSTACSEAFGVNYGSFLEEEPAKKSNFHAPKFRRAVERIKLPETR